MNHLCRAAARAHPAALRLWAAVLCVVAVAIAAPAPAVAQAPLTSGDNPLTPPDLSSPRASYLNFRSNSDEAGRLLVEAYQEEEREPGWLPSAAVRAKTERAEALIRRAARSFDLSDVPPASRASTQIESVLLLKEILDRIPVPPADQFPDAAQVQAAAGDRQPLASWTIPGTEIRFVRITQGAQSGSYLLSADTVGRLEDFYNAVAGHAVKPDATRDLYDFYSVTPGTLLPPKWFPLILALPDWTRIVWLDQAVWQWAALGIAAVLAILAILVAFRYDRRPRPSSTRMARNTRRLLLPVIAILVVWIFEYALTEVINVTGPVLRTIYAVSGGISVLATGWLAIILSNSAVEWILESPKIPSDSLDANLLRAAFRVLGIAAAAVILAQGASNLGIPLVGVIAGLGVGGLAIALAAQPTIENFIGGIILYADRPVRVGDTCRFGDMQGTVEEIGIRSTRVRAGDRTLITVPNSDFAKMRLVNLSRRDRMELKATLGLRYETTTDQLRYVLARLRELLIGHPMVLRDPMRVRLANFGASSLDVEIYAYIGTRDWNEFLAVREDLFLRMLDVVAEAGTGLAFPSQTTYLARDSGLDEERRKEAEARVAGWRESGTLPFPNVDADTLRRLDGTLDWPPKGAAGQPYPSAALAPSAPEA